MANEVMCRVCRQRFNKDELIEGVDWIRPTPKQYYHLKCYNDWKNNRNNLSANGKDENFWYEAMVDYLYQEKKIPLNFPQVKRQWQNYLKPPNKFTAKGIYFAMRYFYDVKNGNKEQSEGRIGIVPYIYNESAEYWAKLEYKRKGVLEDITSQIQERGQRPIEIRKETKKEKKEPRWDLDEI